MKYICVLMILAAVTACGIKSDPVPPPAANVSIGLGNNGLSAGATVSVSPTRNTRITIGL